MFLAASSQSEVSVVATGLEMYDALVRTIAARGNGSVAVNEFDAEDLTRLTADDLRSRGVDAARAERVVSELARGNLRELGDAVGADLTISHEPGRGGQC